VSAWRAFVVAVLGAGSVLAWLQASAPATSDPAPVAQAAAQRPRAQPGTSLIARVRSRRLDVYRRPFDRPPMLRLQSVTPYGGPRVLLVKALHGRWVQVWLAVRPNGSAGWVRASSVTLERDDWRLLVHLRRHRLVVFRDGQELWSTRVAAGAAATPTPRGRFFVTELLRQPDPGGAYGPWVFALSGFSRVLTRFHGGDGELGIHGTNQPTLLGRDVSHGCVRVGNGAIDRLVRELPLGTPVDVGAS
jgi:lipoprotein-anchoring transpeptidase ErfK/SrfK